MGKIRIKTLGVDEVEKKQKEDAKKRSEAKKQQKPEKVKVPGGKGGERGVQVEVSPADLAKMQKVAAVGPEKVTPEEEAEPTKKLSKKKRLRGKHYKAAIAKVDKKKAYLLPQAIALLKSLKYTGFDETVELHINVLEVGLKGEVALPHGTGRKVRVVVADDQVLAQIDTGKIDFDVLIAAPSFMPKLVKYAKILGPKGLMPNPKAGTVSDQPEAVVKKFSGGTIRYKTEPKAPLIHQALGKLSFEDKKLEENIAVFLKAVGGKNIQAVFLKSTMSPSVRIDVSQYS